MNYAECILTGIIIAVVLVVLQNLFRGYTGKRIDKASVKVMRSYDYCHFEVCLGSDTDCTNEQVDDLRKQAARLADKAVEQYKIAKAVREFTSNTDYNVRKLTAIVEKIQQKPEDSWTPVEKANVKKFENLMYERSRSYNYEDDFEDDFLFGDYEPERDPQAGPEF